MWPLDSKGMFSVSSVFNLIISSEDNDEDWSWLWRLNCWEKIKVLLWTIMKGRILTNAERARRHLTVDKTCPICQEEEETIKHLLWDCTAAREAWRFTSSPINYAFRQNDTLASWIKRNISSKDWTVDHTAWGPRFAFMIWGLWKSRNKLVFNGIWANGRNTARQARRNSIEAVSLLSQ